MNILVATNNSGKVREFRTLLAPLPTRLFFPADLGLEIDVKEVGATYQENATLKVQAYAQALQDRGGRDSFLILADDSGLEVDALDGAPGVRSARYTLGSDTDRLTALLAHLEGIPWEQRGARFRCVVVVATPQETYHVTEGVCQGVIATTSAGEGGFGYDPVFYLAEYNCTMAELRAEIKNQISHRARAVQAALPLLRQLLALG